MVNTVMDIKNLITSQDYVPHCGSKESKERSLSCPERPIQSRYPSTKSIAVSPQQTKNIPWDFNHRQTGHTPWGLHNQQTAHTAWKLNHAPTGHIRCEVDLLSGSEKKAEQRKKNAQASKKVRERKRQQEKFTKYQEECIEVQDKKIKCLLKILGFDSEDEFLVNTPSVTDWPRPPTPQPMPASEPTSVATSPTLSNI